MNPNEYINGAVLTESKPCKEMADRVSHDSALRLLHAAMGMCTESGEFIDTIKKWAFYGKVIDRTNLIEELGDLLWYMAIALDEIDIPFEEVMQINHNKLMKRYKEKKFNSEDAINRDLNAERELLDNSVK